MCIRDRGKPEQNVHVGQPEIRVEQHNALAFGGKTAGKIDGQVGFAHAAFTGSDGEDEKMCIRDSNSITARLRRIAGETRAADV